MVNTVGGKGDGVKNELGRVRDIMIPIDEYPWIRLQDTIMDAINVMEEASLQVGRRQSLPRVLLVFDHRDDLVGVVRRRDIMRGLEPDFVTQQPLDQRVTYFEVQPDPNLSVFSLQAMLKGLREQSKRPVSDILKPISTTLKPSDRIMKAVYEMVSLNESLIAVVDQEEVLGVVRSVDLLNELARHL